jgi:hypothetical protein
MSEYLSYTQWRQREERMPQELEQQRAIRERLADQEQDRKQLQESSADITPVLCMGTAPSRPRRVKRTMLVNR